MSDPAFRPRKMLEILVKHEVEFILIGGVAQYLHGGPFPTVDVDVVPNLQTSNLDRLAEAITELEARLRDAKEPKGLPISLNGKTLKKALPEFRFLRLMTKYGYLDLLYEPAGTEGFQDLNRSAVKKRFGPAVEVSVASLADVIRSKQAVGRARDLEQLPTLRRLLEMQNEPEE